MMKLLSLLALTVTTSALAQNIALTDFKNWELNDISKLGLKKEVLFTKMNRDLIKLGNSICSNRALVWANDFKRFNGVDAGKIFLFYTKKTGDVGQKTWWYHVAPAINESGSIWAMDAGFPGGINTPLKPKDWLKKFTGSENCKEIKANETDLVDKMFRGYVFPQKTDYGNFDCYYMVTPGGYWTPATVAMGLLGVDEDGTPIQYNRDEIDQNDVYAACVEAVTSPLGRVLGGGKKRCQEYLGYTP